MNKFWSMVPLAEVPKQRQEMPSADALAKGDIRILAKIGFDDGKIQLRNSTETKTGMILARPGDLVVSGINATKGAIAIYDEGGTEPIAATIHYGAYIPDKNKIDVHYLWWLLRSRVFRDLLQRHVPGGIKTELKSNRLLPVSIPLPHLVEQRRIVARIKKLAAKIGEAKGLRHESVSETDALLSKTLKQAFEPYSDKMLLLGDAFRVTTGGTPSRSNPLYWDGGVNWVSSGEVAFCRITDTAEKITDLALENSNAQIYPPGTVLLAMIGQGKTRGQCAILECSAATNQNIAGIHVYETRHNPDYLYWWLYSRYRESRQVETGTAQPALSGERVKQIPVPLPSPEEQRRIAMYLEGWEAKVSTLKQLQAETAAKLDAILPSIFDKAFKGEM